jgi:Transposase
MKRSAWDAFNGGEPQKTLRGKRRGWMQSPILGLWGGGENIALDIPFYRTAGAFAPCAAVWNRCRKSLACFVPTRNSLNWRHKGEISAGAVEGLNNEIRVVTRRSYGFRTYEAMELALYHTLGRLPEPESAHRFC